VTDGPRRTRLTCTYAHGWEMELGDQGNRRGRMRGGARKWRGLCNEEGVGAMAGGDTFFFTRTS